MNPDETIYAGESQFAGWSDSHTGGPKITFWLPSAEHLDKFRALTARKGGTAGHRVMLAVVEIGEQEEPVPPPAPTKFSDGLVEGSRKHGILSEPKPKIGPYCIEAIDLCRMPLFWQWASLEAGFDVNSEEQAKAFIVSVLGISSRKEIDGNAEIEQAFTENIRVAFMHWQREQSEGSQS